MARPTKMTSATVKKLEEAFANGLTDNEACCYADITKQTLYNYCKAHTEFFDRKETLKDNIKMHAKINLAKEITVKKDIEMSKWYLERKCKEEFSIRQEVEHSGDMNINNPFAELTTEELKKLVNSG